MRYTCSVVIQAPLTRVTRLFKDYNNRPQWQDNFKLIKSVRGTPGDEGSKTQLTFNLLGKSHQWMESIVVDRLPMEKTLKFDSGAMTFTMCNRFQAISEGTTRWEAEVEWTKMNGFIPRLKAKITPGKFEMEVQQWLNRFQAFAEN